MLVGVNALGDRLAPAVRGYALTPPVRRLLVSIYRRQDGPSLDGVGVFEPFHTAKDKQA